MPDFTRGLGRFKDAVTSDPRLMVRGYRELDYYQDQSRNVSLLITVNRALYRVSSKQGLHTAYRLYKLP